MPPRAPMPSWWPGRQQVGGKVIREAVEGDGAKEMMEAGTYANGLELERACVGFVESKEAGGAEGFNGSRGGAIEEQLNDTGKGL